MADSEFAHEEIAEFESALFSLAPSRSGIDRDRVMFAAGEACGRNVARRAGTVRPSSTSVALGVVSLAFLATLVFAIQQPRVIREVVYVDRPVELSQQPRETGDSIRSDARPEQPPIIGPDTRDFGPVRTTFEAVPADADLNYLQIRDVVLRHGIDALPRREFAASGGSPATSPNRRELLDELLQVQGLSPRTSDTESL